VHRRCGEGVHGGDIKELAVAPGVGHPRGAAVGLPWAALLVVPLLPPWEGREGEGDGAGRAGRAKEEREGRGGRGGGPA
jgi:hypothetical protein